MRNEGETRAIAIQVCDSALSNNMLVMTPLSILCVNTTTSQRTSLANNKLSLGVGSVCGGGGGGGATWKVSD